MPNLKISANYRYPLGPNLTQIEGLQEIISHLQGIASGRVPADSVKYSYNDSVTIGGSGAYGGQAAGLIVMASSSGAVPARPTPWQSPRCAAADPRRAAGTHSPASRRVGP